MIEAIALHAEHTQEIQQFERNYQPQESEITIIINDDSGFSRFSGQQLWLASQKFIAYIDKEGNFIDITGTLKWLVKDYEPNSIETNFSNREGIYKVKVRQHYPANPKDYTDFTENGWQIPDLSSTLTDCNKH